MRKLFLILMMAVACFARPEQSVFNQITNDDETVKYLQNVAPTDEPDDFNPNEVYKKIEPSVLEVVSEISKNSVYEYEIFSMKILVDTKQKLSFDIETKFSSHNLVLLTKEPEWNIVKPGVYETTIWFEPTDIYARLNNIELVLSRNGEFFQRQNVYPQIPLIKELPKNPNFANLVASELKIKEVKSSEFDEFANILRIELEAKNTNLGMFNINLPSIKRQNIDSLKGSFYKQNGSYFAVLDKNESEIKFSYFNLQSKKFETFDVKIDVQTDELSTQVDLNPKESAFALYKDIVLYFIIILLLAGFVYKKNYYILIVAILLCLYAIYDAKPFSDATLKANSQVQILPTHNSIVFYAPKEDENIKIMLKKKNYTKILLKNDQIGWVKNEDIK